MPINTVTKNLIAFILCISGELLSFSLMIDPSGDAKYTGRRIGNTFERSITMLIAQQLKEEIEERYPSVSVTLTRTPGEVIHPLQNANFANRLPADLYINLSCFTDTGTKPTVYLYRYSNQLAFLPPPSLQTFIPYHQSFLVNAHLSSAFSHQLKKQLSSKEYQTLFTVKGVYAFPCKLLLGIIAPAICIECGISNQDQWHHYVPALLTGITALIEPQLRQGT